MNLSDINTIRPLLMSKGFTFSKALGQNFIIDPEVCPKMAQMALEGGCDAVLEIGPGIGVLTKELSSRAEKVVCVELDKRLIDLLGQTVGECKNVTVINGDILKLDLNELCGRYFSGMSLCVCANLPYYITTPVITRLLESGLGLKSATFMVQREVADRLCAPPGTRSSGAVTVLVNYYAKVQRLFEVPRQSFMPSPNVDSTVIKLDMLAQPAVSVKSEQGFFRLVRAAFSMRRKTAVNAISSALGLEKGRVAQAFSDCGIDEKIRAEGMSLEMFAALSDLFEVK